MAMACIGSIAFLRSTRTFGVDLPRDSIRDAFDEAERRSALDDSIASSDFAQMIELHVKWQLAHLGLRDPKLERHLVDGFIDARSRGGGGECATSRRSLVERGFELGCGFQWLRQRREALCRILVTRRSCRSSSIRAGWDFSNQTPRSFIHAAEKLGGDPGSMMMVGDSFDRDVRPGEKGRDENGLARRRRAARMSRSVAGRSSSPQAGRSSRRLVGRFTSSRMNDIRQFSLKSRRAGCRPR